MAQETGTEQGKMQTKSPYTKQGMLRMFTSGTSPFLLTTLNIWELRTQIFVYLEVEYFRFFL